MKSGVLTRTHVKKRRKAFKKSPVPLHIII